MSDGCLFLHAPSKAGWLLCVSVVCLVAFFFFLKWQMHLAISVTLSCTHEQAREPSPVRLFMHSERALSERGVSRKAEA